jgi:hypothetical protein
VGGFITGFKIDDDIWWIGAYIGLLVGLSVIVIFRWIVRGFKEEQKSSSVQDR